MEILTILDTAGPHAGGPRTVRHSARAIIERGGLLLLVQEAPGEEYVFPGGGIKEEESVTQALLREVAEETGLALPCSAFREYGAVVEIQPSLDGTGVFEHHSHFFRCALPSAADLEAADAGKKEAGNTTVLITPEEAAAHNRRFLGHPGKPWTGRLLYLLDRLAREALPAENHIR